MNDFKTYWEEKAQKRRKSWAAKSKQFAEQHKKLEVIRKKVFLPFEYVGGFDFYNFTKPHHAKRNPFAVWQQGVFSFSEDSLREAMIAQGADISHFKMEECRLSIVGKDAPRPEVTDYYANAINNVYLIRNKYRAWLKRIYEICTDVQICKLTYGQVSMIIRRYSSDGLPFAYYELIPCEQLVRSAMLMEETSFNRLNIATLLMEMAAEYDLRQEELNYYAKKLKLRTMEAVTIEGIDFELWDDKKLQEKLKEYVKKDYTLDKVMDQVLRPWKLGVQKFMGTITQRDIQDNAIVLEPRNCFYIAEYTKQFVNQNLRSYLDSQGLQEVKAYIPAYSSKQCIMEYQGYRMIIKRDYSPDAFIVYPFADEDRFIESNSDKQHITLRVLTLSAIAEYLKQVPTISPRIAAMKTKVKERYNIISKQYGHSNQQ